MSARLFCEWYAKCDHDMDGLVAHPILGQVPCCQRCADRHELTFSSFVIECQSCGELHAAEYHHPGQGPIFAVVCPRDELTDYYTTELLIVALPPELPAWKLGDPIDYSDPRCSCTAGGMGRRAGCVVHDPKKENDR